MKTVLIAAVAGLGGLVAGWFLPQWLDRAATEPTPADWIARIDGDYIDRDRFVAEMRQRGGTRPGQFQALDQKQALLDDLLYRKAVIKAARAEGLDQQPAVRRALEQILITRYIQQHLRPRQEKVEIDRAAIEAAYAELRRDYTIPARRRVAMIHVGVPDQAPPEVRERARQRAAAALEEARRLDDSIRHFGALAREYSEDQASRYRGGVIGWIGEAAPERYRYDPVVVNTANRMREPGTLSEVLEGEDGFYLVRLVDHEPARQRSLDELAAGIRQRLLRERYQQVEQTFRDELVGRFEVEVRADALADIDPLGPPAAEQPRRPPDVPAS